MNRFGHLMLVSALLLVTSTAAADSIVEASLGGIEELRSSLPRKGWTWQRVTEPCSVAINGDAAIVEGGKAFLHSAEFPVDASTVYDVELKGAGTGTLAVELLWWTTNGLPTRGHRSVIVPPTRLHADSQTLSGSVRSPADAQTAYLRLVGADGRVRVEAPSVDVASGELLLQLDAAAPGPSADTSWTDLTGKNGDFTLQSVRHAPANASYIFEQPGAACVGQKEDANRFNFGTDGDLGSGRGTPFTVVIYAKLTGRSSNGIVNKMFDSRKQGWSIGLEWDEFNLDRVSTLLQAENGKDRTIDGFPGLAGHNNQKLNARDGKFHLFVIHITGSGRHDGSVFVDGSVTPLSRTPWPFGALGQGSIRNDAPLRIGAFSENGFRGEVGFVEVWQGSRLRGGLTPAEYSKHRFNNGSPTRSAMD